MKLKLSPMCVWASIIEAVSLCKDYSDMYNNSGEFNANSFASWYSVQPKTNFTPSLKTSYITMSIYTTHTYLP